MRQSKGFTLIEIIMVIVILGILAVVAVPKYFDLTSDAKDASEKGVVGGVRAGIMTYFAKNKAYPAAGGLDGTATDGACTAANVCFDTVLQQGGITSDWVKAGDVYTGPTGTDYTYTPSNGDFK